MLSAPNPCTHPPLVRILGYHLVFVVALVLVLPSTVSANTGKPVECIPSQERMRKSIAAYSSPSGLIDEDHLEGGHNRFRANPYGNAMTSLVLKPAAAKKTLSKWESIYLEQIRKHGSFQGLYFFYDEDGSALMNSEHDRKLTAQSAWMSLATLHYEKRTGDKRFAAFRNGLNNWIWQQYREKPGAVTMGQGSYHGELGNGCMSTGTTHYNKVIATEHNVDAYAALIHSPRRVDRLRAAKLRRYLLGRFDAKTGLFDGGYEPKGFTASERPLDAQTWLILSMSEKDRKQYVKRFNTALDNVLKKFVITDIYHGKTVRGAHSGNLSGKNCGRDIYGVWSEGTYGLIGALRAMAKTNHALGKTDKGNHYNKEANALSYEMGKLQQPNGALDYDSIGVWSGAVVDFKTSKFLKRGKPLSHMSGTAWSLAIQDGINPFNPHEKLPAPKLYCKGVASLPQQSSPQQK